MKMCYLHFCLLLDEVMKKRKISQVKWWIKKIEFKRIKIKILYAKVK